MHWNRLLESHLPFRLLDRAGAEHQLRVINVALCVSGMCADVDQLCVDAPRIRNKHSKQVE